QALDPDLAPVQLDELPAEGQSQPCALYLLVRRPHLAELLEHRLLILGCDADASVADRPLHEAILRHGRDVDPAALRRELDGVGQEVEDDLPDLPLVRRNLAAPLVKAQ